MFVNEDDLDELPDSEFKRKIINITKESKEVKKETAWLNEGKRLKRKNAWVMYQ